MKCVECEEIIEFHFMEEINNEMRERQMCFYDNFWARMKDLDESGEYLPIITATYHHYTTGPEDAPKISKGFGGAKATIEFDTGIEVTSTNLWHQGQIPERWQDRFEPNAEVKWQ